MDEAPGSCCAFPQDGITEQGLCDPVESLLKRVSVRLISPLPPLPTPPSSFRPPHIFPHPSFLAVFLPPPPLLSPGPVCLLLGSARLGSSAAVAASLPAAGVSAGFTLRDPPSYQSPTCFPSSSTAIPPDCPPRLSFFFKKNPRQHPSLLTRMTCLTALE